MKPGEEVEYRNAVWEIQKMELRGSEVWVLLLRYEGNGKNREPVARAWVRQEELES